MLHIQGIKTNHHHKVKVVDLTYLLTNAEQKYQEIESWNGEEVESEFVGNDGCWNCGSLNHYTRDCPHPDRQSGRGGCGGGPCFRGVGRRRLTEAPDRHANGHYCYGADRPGKPGPGRFGLCGRRRDERGRRGCRGCALCTPAAIICTAAVPHLDHA